MTVNQLIQALRERWPDGGDMLILLDMGKERRGIGGLDEGNEYGVIRADWYPEEVEA